MAKKTDNANSRPETDPHATTSSKNPQIFSAPASIISGVISISSAGAPAFPTAFGKTAESQHIQTLYVKYIIAIFKNSDNQSFTYANANDGGSWKVCNPRAEVDVIAERNGQTNGNLKHLCRMMRVWQHFCSVPISGMLIDTLAYQFIENYEHRDKSFLYHDYMARDFFDFLSKQNQKQEWWRAPGSGSNVQRSGVFEFKARSAQLRAKEAIVYNDDNHVWSRRQKWREVFGPLYPG
jgi:hypothetical protein